MKSVQHDSRAGCVLQFSQKLLDLPGPSNRLMSPISSDHVFIGGRDKGLHCINRISGKQTWRFSARGRIDSSPVVSKDKVIFGSMDGKLYIISTLTGKELLSYEVGEPISSTPAVVNDRVLVGCEDGLVYCFTTSYKR